MESRTGAGCARRGGRRRREPRGGCLRGLGLRLALWARAECNPLRPAEDRVTARVPSGDFLFETQLHAGIRSAAVLRAQPPERLEAIRAAMADAVRRYADGDAFALPITARLVSARAPRIGGGGISGRLNASTALPSGKQQRVGFLGPRERLTSGRVNPSRSFRRAKRERILSARRLVLAPPERELAAGRECRMQANAQVALQADRRARRGCLAWKATPEPTTLEL
jgi:hypothetical protein